MPLLKPSSDIRLVSVYFGEEWGKTHLKRVVLVHMTGGLIETLQLICRDVPALNIAS